MNVKVPVVLISGLLFACAPPPPPTPAPAPPPPAAAALAPEAGRTERHIVAIRAVQCDALLTLSEDDRASASMFYIGYTASRRGQAQIDVAELSGIEAAALGYCATYPSWPAATAFNTAFADNGR
jgi:hypothetical protein